MLSGRWRVLLIYGVAAGLVAFTITLIAVDWWISIGRRMRFLGRDMNKPGEVYAVRAGGIWVTFGASFGLLVLIAIYRYLCSAEYYIPELMGLALLLFMASFLGFLDDFLGWKKGLRVWKRIVFMAPLALPMIVIKAGVSTISLPFIGTVNLGLLYPLVLVPIGILGASNAFNMIAGYNGLEAGMALILTASTFVFSYVKGIEYIALASLIMAFSLVAFLVYNWYPAKVFPGNCMTYGFGAYYASLVILGNFEKFGLLQFALYFIEFLLFFRGLLNHVYKENFGKIEDGTLKPPYRKSYSLTHIAIKIQLRIRGYATEKGVVVILLALQSIVSAASIALTLTGFW